MTAPICVSAARDIRVWTPSALGLATIGTLQTPLNGVSVLYTNSLRKGSTLNSYYRLSDATFLNCLLRSSGRVTRNKRKR